MTTATGYQMPSADGTFEKTTIERRALEPLDVQIEIKYAGICHSDIHTARNEWGNTAYPVVPGHEIAGIVTAVGPDVTRHKVGDRVGVGCFVDSCLDLDQYLALLAVDGTFVELGAPEHPMELSAFSLIPNRRAVAGSLVGGLGETQEMLDFCAEHDTPPEIEVISADQIDEAYDRVVASDVRYRFVIDAGTM
jgi:D-arabinose 1-dehydrogenase-like Zn-dependent alcohol dehydrogenase